MPHVTSIRALATPLLTLVAFTTLAGCESSAPSPDARPAARTAPEPEGHARFTLADGTGVEIVSHTLTASPARVTLDVIFDGRDARTVTLEPHRTDDRWRGWRHTIAGASGVTFGFTLVARADGAVEVSEWTPSDRLTFRVTPLDASIHEVYVLNGRMREWTRRVGDPLGERRAREALDALLPAGSSLNASPDGERLAQLLASRGFLRWLETGGLGQTPTALTQEEEMFVCSVATACGAVKCLLGAWANPICHVCTGTSIICAAKGILCQFLPCG